MSFNYSLDIETKGVHRSSLLKGVFRADDEAFSKVMRQMIEGTVELYGQELSMEEDLIAVSLLLNKFNNDIQTRESYFTKMINFEDKLLDQINQAVT